MVHTNHYLVRSINPDDGDFCNSYARFRTANDKASTTRKFTIDKMKKILSDRSDSTYPIWRTYKPDTNLQEVGTVATIIMDLKEQKLHIRKGNIKYLERVMLTVNVDKTFFNRSLIFNSLTRFLRTAY